MCPIPASIAMPPDHQRDSLLACLLTPSRLQYRKDNNTSHTPVYHSSSTKPANAFTFRFVSCVRVESNPGLGKKQSVIAKICNATLLPPPPPPPSPFQDVDRISTSCVLGSGWKAVWTPIPPAPKWHKGRIPDPDPETPCLYLPILFPSRVLSCQTQQKKQKKNKKKKRPQC